LEANRNKLPKGRKGLTEEVIGRSLEVGTIVETAALEKAQKQCPGDAIRREKRPKDPLEAGQNQRG